MSLPQINQFLTSAVPQESVLYFNKLKESDIKMIRSAVLVFNLTPRESNLISFYAITRVQPTFGELLRNRDHLSWLQLTFLVFVFSLLISNIKNIAFDELRSFIGGNCSNLVDRKVKHCMYTAGYFLAFSSFFLRMNLRKMIRVKVTIMPYERTLPSPLANKMTEEGGVEEPVTYEPISRDRLKSPRFIYLTNYAMDITQCMKAILSKRVSQKNIDLSRFEHPLEGYLLSGEDSNNLEDRLIRVFGEKAVKIAKPSLNLTPDEKIQKFLKLFDKSVYPFLVAFQNDI